MNVVVKLLFFSVVVGAPHSPASRISVGVDAVAPSPTPSAAAPANAPRHQATRSSAAFYPRGRDRPHGYAILSEEVRYDGWRRVLRRRVRPPPSSGPSAPIDFDVVDQACGTAGAAIIFAWNTTSKTATIIQEYMPGPHRVLSGLAAGVVEEDKHADALVAARHELEEECHLSGGTWHRLTEDGVSVPMDKYAVTEITPYLVIDPQPVTDPRPRDAEEDIEIVAGVSAADVVRRVREGDFNLVGGWAALLALQRLRELGEIE